VANALPPSSLFALSERDEYLIFRAWNRQGFIQIVEVRIVHPKAHRAREREIIDAKHLDRAHRVESERAVSELHQRDFGIRDEKAARERVRITGCQRRGTVSKKEAEAGAREGAGCLVVRELHTAYKATFLRW
jgi:hypothetical protein